MIRDRGILKWQPAHFLPEHRKMLNQITNEATKQKKPLLDEQQFEEIGFIVMESLNYSISIKVTIWHDGFFQDISGIVHKVDKLMKYILVKSNNGITKIHIKDITAVKRV